jgi:hypothetical protein
MISLGKNPKGRRVRKDPKYDIQTKLLMKKN